MSLVVLVWKFVFRSSLQQTRVPEVTTFTSVLARTCRLAFQNGGALSAMFAQWCVTFKADAQIDTMEAELFCSHLINNVNGELQQSKPSDF